MFSKYISALYSSEPLPLRAAVDIGGPGDLRLFLKNQKTSCDNKVINKLLGDDPKHMETNLSQSSPYELLPLGVKQLLITGELDQAASPAIMQLYLEKAKKL